MFHFHVIFVFHLCMKMKNMSRSHLHWSRALWRTAICKHHILILENSTCIFKVEKKFNCASPSDSIMPFCGCSLLFVVISTRGRLQQQLITCSPTVTHNKHNIKNPSKHLDYVGDGFFKKRFENIRTGLVFEI